MRSARKRALAVVIALAMLLAEPCMALHAEPAEAAGMTAEAGSITGTGEAEPEAGEGTVSEEMDGASIQEDGITADANQGSMEKGQEGAILPESGEDSAQPVMEPADGQNQMDKVPVPEMLPEQAPGEAAPENGQAASEQDKPAGGQEQQNQNVPDSLPEISGGGSSQLFKSSSTQTPDSVARVTAGGNTVYVENLADAFLPQNGDVEILMLADARLDETVKVTGGNYTLDLNGQTIRSGLAADPAVLPYPDLFYIEKAEMTIQDDSGKGCILSEIEPKGTCINFGDLSKFLFSGGTIRGFGTGICMEGGYWPNISWARVTGNACIQSTDIGINVISGSLSVSGEAQVYGENFGIITGGLPDREAYVGTGAGEAPFISGNIGLKIRDSGNSHVTLMGGTFSGVSAAIEQRNDWQFVGYLLANYGEIENQYMLPRFAYYDSSGLIKDIAQKSSLTGKVWVGECSHDGCMITHTDGTTMHMLGKQCTACTELPDILLACDYVWEREGNKYSGRCWFCNSLIEVTLEEERVVYNGDWQTPDDVKVVLDGKNWLVPEKDYYINGENHKNAGQAKAFIVGTGQWREGYWFACETVFEIAQAPVSVNGVTAADRVYDGTNRVKIREASLEGVFQGDAVSVAADSLCGSINGTSAGSYNSVTVHGDYKLAGDAAGNYVLEPSPKTFASGVIIQKAKASAREAALKVQSGKAQDYTLDLSQLLPQLPQGQEFGSTPVIYELGNVSISGDYYAGGARIDGSMLTLPVQAAGSGAEGVIGSVAVTIKSENFEDMAASVTVSASAGENSGGSAGGDTGSSSGSSTGTGGYWPSVSGPARPFLKDRPEKAGWTVIQNEAEKAPEGSVLQINMNGTSAMPGKMAEILRDRRQTAVLDMGSAFSWSISGKGAPAGMLTDMDFAIRRGPGTVPEELLREKAGKNPCAQLRLAQEGAFGPEAVLVMQTGNVSWAVADAGTGGAAGSGTAPGTAGYGSSMAGKAKYAGLYANLYLYDQAEGTLEFEGAGQIAQDGTVHLAFTHGSRYAVILTAQPAEGWQKPDSGADAAGSGLEPDGSGDVSGTEITENETESGSADASESADGDEERNIKTIKLSKTVFTYTGHAKKPSVIATDAAGRRIASKYYKVTYRKNKKAGTASARVVFRGAYQSCGTVELDFTIRPAKPVLKKAVPAAGAFTAAWKKTAQADGYQVQYSMDAGFQGSSTHSAFVKKPSVTRKTVRNLKEGRTYYVRVRAYKSAASGGKSRNIYSAWSSPVRTGKLPAARTGNGA